MFSSIVPSAALYVPKNLYRRAVAFFYRKRDNFADTTRSTAMSPRQVIDFFGTQAATAKALGLTQPTVSGWLTDGAIPIERQYQIEMATNGALRADLPALRVQAA
jgi:ParB-like chromosome segregation protein Spo0J